MLPPLFRSIFTSLLLFFLLFSNWVSSEDDIKCLQEVKNSLTDPTGKLNSWKFSNTSVGFICNFDGVTCWNDRENRLLSLQLRDSSLAGKIPASLQFCHSLQTLDLSGNNLSGSIPPQICTWLPYLVTLDLSHNELSGEIPADLANCTYLNHLILDDNRLSGNIPIQFSSLGKLKKFTVANNDLSGRVPEFMYDVELDFGGNSGLSGAAGSLLGFSLWRWCFSKNRKRGYG